MKFVTFCTMLLFLFQCCEDNSQQDDVTYSNLTFYETMNQLPSEYIEGMVQRPAEDGAMGRNVPDYFHVRFQLGIATLGAYAVYFKSEQALHYLATAIKYSFDHQFTAGDFEIIVPPNLQHLGEPRQSDLTSGIAFFGASLGQALVLIQHSQWYQQLPDLHPDKIIIEQHRSKIQAMLRYLLQQKQTLMTIDLRASNRLLWDATCFYSLGMYLNDEAALKAGVEFINAALDKQAKGGYFIENGGHDSSYNGVSMYFAAILYSMQPAGDLKSRLADALKRCATWQMRRINSAGEISLKGNTRVYPGGEIFLGEEKTVAWKDSVLGLNILNILSGYPSYQKKADAVRKYYE